MTDFMDYQQELLETTKEAIELSKEYLASRQTVASNFNRLQVLISKAGLEKTKKSPENKIIELMAHDLYGADARNLNSEMLIHEANYKGLELCVKAYLAHSSALQSVIKQQTQGEISESMKVKYGG